MRDARNGLKQSRAVYTHCYGHALNLATADLIKNSMIMKDALDVKSRSIFPLRKMLYLRS